MDLGSARLGLCNGRSSLLAKPELSGSAIAKITFLRNVFEELGGTEVGVNSLGTRHLRKKVPGTGAAGSPKIWLHLEQCLVFVLAENLCIPARFQRAVGKCPLPRGPASCSPRHPGGWLCSRLSTVRSCPEKYRGQLTVPSGAQALIILGSVLPINCHYFYHCQHCLRQTATTVRCCSGCS